MSTFSRALLIFALLIAASIARSEGIYNPTAGGWFNFTGGLGGGPISNPSGGGIPAGCAAGAIDASAGCPLPMLGM